MAYQVRNWDSFYENYVMIPREFDSRDEAIEFAKEYIEENMGGSFDPYFNELQIWIDTLTKDAWQMVGYMEIAVVDSITLEEEPIFEECFC